MNTIVDYVEAVASVAETDGVSWTEELAEAPKKLGRKLIEIGLDNLRDCDRGVWSI